jgi:phage shock protein A
MQADHRPEQALAAGREDLAREALIRRAAATSQISDLQSQQASLQAEEDKLTLATQRLQAKVETFRTRKETIKAAYTAAEAETHIGAAVSGISEEMGDIGLAMQRPGQDRADAGPGWRTGRAAGLRCPGGRYPAGRTR